MPTYDIVGHFHHRPAKAILAVLPIGHPLDLIPEPSNEYDPNAIAVWVDGKTLGKIFSPETKRELDSLASGYGFSAQEIFEDIWKIGYIGRYHAAKLNDSPPTDSKTGPHGQYNFAFKTSTGRFLTGAGGGPKVEI